MVMCLSSIYFDTMHAWIHSTTGRNTTAMYPTTQLLSVVHLSQVRAIGYDYVPRVKLRLLPLLTVYDVVCCLHCLRFMYARTLHAEIGFFRRTSRHLFVFMVGKLHVKAFVCHERPRFFCLLNIYYTTVLKYIKLYMLHTSNCYTTKAPARFCYNVL